MLFGTLKDTIFGNPNVSHLAFVSSKATVIGLVIIEEYVIVAPGASIRADEGSPFRICRGTNMQDGVILHGLLGKYVEIDGVLYSIYIGSHCSIAHGAIIHGPSSIGNKTFVGFRAIVHNSRIGRECFIGHGAQVIGVEIGDRRYVPNGMVVDSQEIADQLPVITEKHLEFNKEVVDYNKKLVELYKERRKMKNRVRRMCLAARSLLRAA
jgi:SulP family sulfate permease